MKFGASGQDYLEAIYELSRSDDEVRSIDVAEKLSVTRASVSRAIGVLKKLGYIRQEKYSVIKLTPEGINAADSIINRHTTLKSFLTDILEVSDATAEEDACKLEHHISIETFDKLKRFMNENKQWKA